MTKKNAHRFYGGQRCQNSRFGGEILFFDQAAFGILPSVFRFATYAARLAPRVHGMIVSFLTAATSADRTKRFSFFITCTP